jgi:uncharacterized protein (DUF58 family)
MTPSLERSAKLVLLTAVLFTAVGYWSQSWALAVIGEVPIFALLAALIAFYPSLLMLRRRRVELLWWIPGGDVARSSRIINQPFTVRIIVRNKGFSDVFAGRLHILGGSALQLASPDEAGGFVVPRLAEVSFDLPIVAKAAGHWQLHGASLEIKAPFGLFNTQVYFPNPLELTVLPSIINAKGLSHRPRMGTLQPTSGAHFMRRPGIGIELREIREFVPGDSFKQIEWKATARLSKMMSREFESEITIEARILLDSSPSMREGVLGQRPLDQAISLAGTLARIFIDSKDRVGLTSYDTRVVSQVRAAEGMTQLQQILSSLLELQRITDEDLCDINDAELVTLVAKYLAYQQGVSSRARPGKTPEGAIITGSDGQRYDLFRMTKTIEDILLEEKQSGTRIPDALPKARDPRSALLRQFCRARGIELSYRTPSPIDPERGQILGQLLTQTISQGKGSLMMIVVSDLLQVADTGAITRALMLAKRRHHRTIFVVPTRQLSSDVKEAQEILQHERARARRPIMQALKSMGIQVICAGPEESLAALVRRLASMRRAA